MRKITIGRSSDCDIVISGDNTSISRIHAEISRNGNQFVYHDLSQNGTTINGRIFHNERVLIAPGTNVLLANKVPLPWAEVYALLPHSVHVASTQTVPGIPAAPQTPPRPVYQNPQPAQEDRLGVGLSIASFLVPIAGWIMFFIWKDQTPKRARTAGILGLVGFAINFVVSIVLSFVLNFLVYY